MTDSPSHPLRARRFSPSFKEAAVARLEAGEALAAVNILARSDSI